MVTYEQYRDALLSALESAFDDGIIDYYTTSEILSFLKHWSPDGGYNPPRYDWPLSFVIREGA